MLKKLLISLLVSDFRKSVWSVPSIFVAVHALSNSLAAEVMFTYCKAFLGSVLLSLYRVSKIKGYAKSADSASSLHAFDFIYFFN